MNYVFAAAVTLLALSYPPHNTGKKPSLRIMANRGAPALDQIDDKRDPASLRRLESVTWDSVKHTLIWDVSKGERKGNRYQPQSRDRYEINMDDATMTVNGESRRFSADEASDVRTLMDFISRYALESTVWWENGEGDPVDDRGLPVKPERRIPSGPNKENNTKAIQIVEGRLIGRNS
jgi:hypothetical protein